MAASQETSCTSAANSPWEGGGKGQGAGGLHWGQRRRGKGGGLSLRPRVFLRGCWLLVPRALGHARLRQGGPELHQDSPDALDKALGEREEGEAEVRVAALLGQEAPVALSPLWLICLVVPFLVTLKSVDSGVSNTICILESSLPTFHPMVSASVNDWYLSTSL